MDVVLFILGTIFYFLICGIGLFLVILGLPGLWVIIGATALYAWTTGEISWSAFAVFFILSLLAELFEAVVGAWGAKKYGGTKWGMLGAIMGGILGAILLSPLLPVVGSIIGAFLGSFGGAFILEYMTDRDYQRARQAGKGAFLGKTAAVVVKMGLGVGIIISSFALIVFR